MIQRLSDTENKKGTILFIHGMCMGSWCWEPFFMPYFSEHGYDCYAIDLRLHDRPGRRKGIHRLSLMDYVADVENAVAAIGEDLVLIGHSMGGLIIQKYLEKHPARAAILLAPAPPAGVMAHAAKLIVRHPVLLRYLLTRDLLGAFRDHAHWLQFSLDMDRAALDAYKQKMCSESFRVFLEMQRPSVLPWHHRETPMLILAAENDRIVPLSALQLAAERYHAELHVIRDIAHHMVLDSGHDRVAKVTLDWLEKVHTQAVKEK